MNMTTRVKEDHNGSWNDVQVVRKSTFEYISSLPEKAAVGDIWAILSFTLL